MTVIDWFKYRKKSRFADDKALEAFTRVCDQTGILKQRDPVDELAAFLAKPESEQLAGIDDLANMLGQKE